MDAELFDMAIEAARIVESEKGIGTLSEGLLHSAVKYYYQPIPELHEVKLGGFVCDAVVDDRSNGRTIIEVQTANFRNLRKKLEYFLGESVKKDETCLTERGDESGSFSISREITALNGVLDDALHNSDREVAEKIKNVTVVYPMSVENRLIWVAPDTGEVTRGGRSKRGMICAKALWELYGIRDFIGKVGFTFVILGVSTEERKLLCGWSKDRKRGSRRIERLPVALIDEKVFRELSDYVEMVPVELRDQDFTAAVFSKATKLTPKTGNAALRCLTDIELLEREKVGRGYIYRVKPELLERYLSASRQ